MAASQISSRLPFRDQETEMELDKDFPRLIFLDSTRPLPGIRINYISILKSIRLVRGIVDDDVWGYVRQSRLGVIAKFLDLDFGWTAKLVHHHLLCSQLECKKAYELWFLISGQPLRFSIAEFEDITSLNCADECVVSGDDIHREAQLFFQCFQLKRGQTTPRSFDIQQLCTNSPKVIATWSMDENLRLCYLAFLSYCLLAVDRRSQIPLNHAEMVMDLEAFETYPWGRKCFLDICTEVKSVTKYKLGQKMNTSYVLKGFAQVLQVFLFVHVPSVGAALGSPITSAPGQEPPVPGLLKYKGIANVLRITDTHFIEVRVIPMSSQITLATFYNQRSMNATDGDYKIDNLTKYILEKKL